jgi:hypothetical protein
MFPDDEDDDSNDNNETSIELIDFPDDRSSNTSRISMWPLLAKKSHVPVASSLHAQTGSKSSVEQTLGVGGRGTRSTSRGHEDRPVVASTVRPDVRYGVCWAPFQLGVSGAQWARTISDISFDSREIHTVP